jgi:glycosyltransferase involved in cell wall biosynthesis
VKQFDRILTANRNAAMYRTVVGYCAEHGKTKNIWIKVHTRRERRVVKELFGFENCFDYPLVFLNDQERSESWSRSDRSTFMQRHGFNESDKIIGLFGYLSGYKGIETAIQALPLLPANYKLALFGSQHPQTIRPNVALDPYLERLFKLVETVEEGAYQKKLKEKSLARSALPAGLVEKDENLATVLPAAELELPKLMDRVRFVGSLDDPEFIEALRLCDVVVLPYMEVGQSMSGVVVLAMEAGAKMLCANNLSFIETRRYFGGVFANFDIGNYSELAQKAQKIAENPQLFEYRESREKAFATYSIEKSVALQLSKLGNSANA